MNTFTRLVNDESAATAIEYGMIAFFVGAVIALAVTSLGGTVNGLFSTVSTDLK